MNEQNLEQELEAIADEFDALAFLDRIMVNIQNVQSKNSALPNTLFSGPTDVSASANAGESKLNAFLRILGFPATRREDELSDASKDKLEDFRKTIVDNPNFESLSSIDKEIENETKRLLSQNGTLNYVSPDKVSTLSDDVLGDLSKREQDLTKSISGEEFLKLIREPLSITASVNDTEAGSRRPSLFPLVVNADVPVFPLRKRIAPFFYDGDYVLGSYRLSRPFIENIIYIRIKSFSGQESTLKDFLKKNIENEVKDTPGAESISEQLIADLDKFPTLELQLVQKFIKILKSSAKSYADALSQIRNLQTKIDLIMVPKKEPMEKAGENKALSREEQIELIGAVDKPGEENVTVVNKVLDEKINRLQQELNKLDSFLQLLPTESVKQSDKIRRLGEFQSLNNISNDIFVSEFTTLTSYEREALEDLLNEAKSERARLVQQYEDARQLIMYFTGEFTGLSIFDIICVLFALFTVEIKYLIALLNEDAQSNLLNNDLFYSIASSDNTVITLDTTIDDIVEGVSAIGSPGIAVKEIQDKVKEYFDLSDAFLQSFKTPENKPNIG